MTEKISDYRVKWNDEDKSIIEVYEMIESGIYPDRLLIDNPKRALLSFKSISPTAYTLSRLGPGSGARRSFANINISKEALLSYILDIFSGLPDLLVSLGISRQKLQRLQVEASKKVLNSMEIAAGKPVNEGVRSKIAQMLGERAPVRGAYNVPSNMARINTTLFQGGRHKSSHTKKKSKRSKRKIQSKRLRTN
jgi:hypothetical protein